MGNEKFREMYNLRFRTDFQPFIKEWKENVKENVERALNSEVYLTSRVVLLAHYFINNPNNQEIEIYDEEEIKNYDEELYIRVKLFKDVLLKLLENTSTDNQERARKLRNEQKERARRLRNEQNQKRVVVSGCSIGKPYLKILNNIRLS